MAINFPNSPNNGDIYTVSGKQWIYEDGKWATYGLAIAPDTLKVDSVNNRVGVNNLTPAVDLDVTGNAAVSGNVAVTGDVTANAVSSSVGDLDTLIRSACPIGTIQQFAGSSSPDSTWLICDGSAVSRTTYAALFAVLGTTYGSGDGSTTFNIPNMKGRVPVGLDAGQTEFDTLGETGGAKTHTLTESEMPSHTHTQNAHTHTQDSHNHTQNPHNHTMDTKFSGQDTVVSTSIKRVDYQNNRYADSASFNFSIYNTTATNQATTATNQNTGGGNAHNNLQPYIALNYIMKAA